MRLPILLITLLVGCGGYEPLPIHGACTMKGVGHVELEDVRDCDCIVGEVQRALDVVKAKVGDTSFMEETVVHFNASDSQIETESGYAQARYINEEDTIQLGRWGSGLVHEMFHVYEMKVEKMSAEQTEKHTDWIKKGYFSLDDTFTLDVDPDTGHDACF